METLPLPVSQKNPIGEKEAVRKLEYLHSIGQKVKELLNIPNNWRQMRKLTDLRNLQDNIGKIETRSKVSIPIRTSE